MVYSFTKCVHTPFHHQGELVMLKFNFTSSLTAGHNIEPIQRSVTMQVRPQTDMCVREATFKQA